MLRVLLLVVSLAWPCVSLHAIEKEPFEAYKSRRDRLVAALKDGPTVIYGATEPDTGNAVYGFHQNEPFYYLTGVTEPAAALMLVPTGEGRPARETLFLAKRNPVQERWTGPKPGPDDPDIQAKTGFASVKATSELETELKEALGGFRTIYTIVPFGAGPDSLDFERDKASKLKAIAPGVSVHDATPEITRLRSVKGPSELALLEKAANASMDAHRAAFQQVHPGDYEYQVSALMQYVFQREGCERPAYAPIVGSGFNSTVLHYSANTRRMQAGDLVVMDVAGEYSGYASDITRTLPVSGKFTKRQREIYDIVLGAQKAVIAAIKPGIKTGRGTTPEEATLQKIAFDYINTHGKDSHGERLGKYFIHGIGHSVGLDVHDPITPGPLQAGMVITVEPGIYLPEESLGVRIEDEVLVTEDGARVLTRALPKEADEIERAMRKK